MKAYTRKQTYVLSAMILLKYFVVKGLKDRKCTFNGIKRCCDNNFEQNGICQGCPNVTESKDGVNCTICTEGFFGQNCAAQCKCKSQICHHIDGRCIEATTQLLHDLKEVSDDNGPTKMQEVQEKDAEQNPKGYQGDQTIMISSLVIAAASLAIVIMILTIRCATKLRVEASNLMKVHCTQDKDMPQKRKKNVYGTCHGKKLHIDDDDDEYEFDVEEEEDQYAVIRESQMITTLALTEENDTSSVCESYGDEQCQYNTTMYNHLFGKEEYCSASPTANYPKTFVTFQDDYA